MIDLAQVLAKHWPSYQQRFGEKILPSHRRAVAAILSCRTPAQGAQIYRCGCGAIHFAYHSCQHRACPKCGHGKATQWLQNQKTRLLPVPYFLLTFTVPAELRALFRSHQKLLYNLLFLESAAALQEVAARPKYLGGELGFIGALHTWSRQLSYHPHVHYVVLAGALRADGLRWMRLKDSQFFLPQRVLARRFRNRLRQALSVYPNLLAQVPDAVWNKEWVVDVEQGGSGESVLKYLSAYIYRTALSGQRILADDANGITFRYRDSDDGKWRRLTLHPHEFLRRFLQHILPKGFQRLRYFGWLSPAAKKKRQRIFALLDWTAPPKPLPPGWPTPLCPRCQQPMRWLGKLIRGPPI